MYKEVIDQVASMISPKNHTKVSCIQQKFQKFIDRDKTISVQENRLRLILPRNLEAQIKSQTLKIQNPDP